MKRYEIQVVQLQDTLSSKPVKWQTFYSAKTCHTRKGAVKEWWKWVNHQWDFRGDRPIFRIWDRKKQEAIYSA